MATGKTWPRPQPDPTDPPATLSGDPALPVSTTTVCLTPPSWPLPLSFLEVLSSAGKSVRGTRTAGDSGPTTWQDLRALALVLVTPTLGHRDLLVALTASTVSGMEKLAKLRAASSSPFLAALTQTLHALQTRPASVPAKLFPSRSQSFASMRTKSRKLAAL